MHGSDIFVRTPGGVIANLSSLLVLAGKNVSYEIQDSCAEMLPDVPGHSKAVKPLQTGRKPLTREELKVLLQSELHHDFLAINFSKLMNKDPQDAFTELEPFIDDLGYKRILVTRSSAFDIPVLKDYSPTPHGHK